MGGRESSRTQELTIRGEHAKDGDTRYVPISTRLAAVLEMAKTDPAGRDYPPTAHVFGVLGERVVSIKKAWETCCAASARPRTGVDGQTAVRPRPARSSRPSICTSTTSGMKPARAGSRRACRLHHVKEILGHANISQTDTYLNAGRDRAAGVDAAVRCPRVANSWQTSPSTEQRPLGHEERERRAKDLLH